MSEAQVPLAVITPLVVPETPPFDDGTGSTFDPSDVQGMFYDSLCCAQPGERCPKPGERPERFGAVPCCPGATCSNQGTCVVLCKQTGEACSMDGQCCGSEGYNVSCDNQQCAQCIPAGDGNGGPACNDRTDCCDAATDPFIDCTENHACVRTCNDAGGSCAADGDCCAVDGQRTSCGSDQVCHSCGLTGIGGSQAGACVSDADCCDGGPNSDVHCVATTGGNKECELVIP
jgi:hypothetical protein